MPLSFFLQKYIAVIAMRHSCQCVVSPKAIALTKFKSGFSFVILSGDVYNGIRLDVCCYYLRSCNCSCNDCPHNRIPL